MYDDSVITFFKNSILFTIVYIYLVFSHCFQANGNMLALATQKEVVELDIGLLLRPPQWLDDDNEYDIEMLKK